MGSGRMCGECCANTSLYVAPADIGFIDRSYPRYSFPGDLYDSMDNKLIEQTRVFYGNCTPSMEPIIIWYTEYKDSDGTRKKGTYQVNLKGKQVKESTNSNLFDSLSSTIDLVGTGECMELEGVNQHSEP